MTDFEEQTNEKEIAWMEDAKDFADREIRPRARELDSGIGVPRAFIEEMGRRGYLAAPFLRQYGGRELDPVHYGQLTEILGKACPNTRSVLTVHTSLVGETIQRWGTKQQKETWLPALANGSKLACFCLSEPAIGTNAKGVQTRYDKTREEYVLTGHKKWITLGNIADVFLVIATGANGHSAFLVERKMKGVHTQPIQGLMANRGTHMAEVHLDHVKVPSSHRLGQEGGGFNFIVNTALDFGRYSIAWAGLAIAQEALDCMVSYSAQREQFGKKIQTFQLVQGMIGDAVTKVHAGRALCLRAGHLRKTLGEEAIIESAIAKYYTSKIAMEIATDAVQIHGANGCTQDYPVERLFREAKILEIIEGTSQVQQEMIAAFGIRQYQRSNYP